MDAFENWDTCSFEYKLVKKDLEGKKQEGEGTNRNAVANGTFESVVLLITQGSFPG